MNSEKQIAVYDNSVTAREYIGHIAESADCFASIGRDGKLYFRNIYQDEVEMAIDLFEQYKWGEEFKISKVSYEDGVRSFKFGDDTGNNLWINQDNVFIVDEEQIERIYNNVKGLTINSFEGSSIIDPAIDIGDKIIIDGKPTVYQGEMVLEGKFVAQFDSKIQIKQKEETTVKKESQKSINRKVRSEIDQIDGRIIQLVQEQTATGEKLSKVEQTVDGISQRVENMADLTNTVSGVKILTLENCVAGPLLELHIYGNNSVFKHLYPSDDLYVSDDLIIYGDSRIEVHGFNGTSEESTFYDVYDLGITEVLRQNEEVCDEYILKDGKAHVIRRVNSDGTTRTEELIEDLGEFSIPLKDVENTIQIQNYTASMEAKFAIQNDYTEIFATKVEMNSSITQTAEEINLEVRKKVDENEIISSINQSAEKIAIKAEKIDINGTVSANGNFKVDTDGNMEANNGKFTGGNIKLIGGTLDNPMFLVTTEDGQFSAIITPNQIEIGDGDEQFSYGNGILNIGIASSGGLIQLTQGGSRSSSKFNMYVGDAYVVQGNMHALQFLYDSLESLKKNITPFNESALELLRNIDIYEYNFKSENDNEKKHIGFVIGDKYKYTKKVTGKDNTGVDNYAYTSLCVKAIQEQQEIIEQLSKEIKELKEGK